MFHHLTAALRVASLREVLRVLRAGGSVHLMDFGGDSHHLHGLAWVARRSHTLRGSWDGRIPILMREAGFSDPTQTGHLTKQIGRLSYWRATCAE
jgi:hypothetical protein